MAAYRDENGNITIDEAAANSDIRKLRQSLEKLKEASNAITQFTTQAENGEGSTTDAMIEKANAIMNKIKWVMNLIEEVIDLIQKAVAKYQELDQKIAAKMSAE